MNRTLLISQSSHLTLITMGWLSCGWMFDVFLSKNVIFDSRASFFLEVGLLARPFNIKILACILFSRGPSIHVMMSRVCYTGLSSPPCVVSIFSRFGALGGISRLRVGSALHLVEFVSNIFIQVVLLDKELYLLFSLWKSSYGGSWPCETCTTCEV